MKPNFGKAPKARYAGSIAFMDNHLGPLLNDLAEQPKSLVGLVSDHGESLGEKGAYGHGYNLHGHEARIVMAWRGRGLQPRRIEGATSLVDVVPTRPHSYRWSHIIHVVCFGWMNDECHLTENSK